MPVSVINAESFANASPMPPHQLMTGSYWSLQPTLANVQYPATSLFPCSAWSSFPSASLPQSPAKVFPCSSAPSSSSRTNWRSQSSSSFKDYFTPLTVDTSVEYEIPRSALPSEGSRPLLMVHPQYYEFRRHLKQQHGACQCQLCLVYGHNPLSPASLSSRDSAGPRKTVGSSQTMTLPQCSGLCCRTRFPPLSQHTSSQRPQTSSHHQFQTSLDVRSTGAREIPDSNSSHPSFTYNPSHQPTPQERKDSSLVHFANYQQCGSDTNVNVPTILRDNDGHHTTAFTSSRSAELGQSGQINTTTLPSIQSQSYGSSMKTTPPSYFDLFPAASNSSNPRLKTQSSRKRHAYPDVSREDASKHPRTVY